MSRRVASEYLMDGRQQRLMLLFAEGLTVALQRPPNPESPGQETSNSQADSLNPTMASNKQERNLTRPAL